MVRTPKSQKGLGFGRRGKPKKKTAAEKSLAEYNRMMAKVIESNVRKAHPTWTEPQIKAEIKRQKAAKKNQPQKPTSYSRYR